MRGLFRTGALIVAAQVAVALFGVVALRIYTDLLTPAVFGATNLVLSALALGLQLFVAGFVAAQLRFYSAAEADGHGNEFTRQTMVWALRVTALLIVVGGCVLLCLRGWDVLSFSNAAAVGGAAWLTAMAVRNVLMSRIQAQRRQGLYAGLQVVEAILLLAVTTGVLHTATTLEAFVVAQVIAVVLLVALVLRVDPRALSAFSVSPLSDRGFGARAWAYGAPFAPMSFLSWLANLGDRYTLAILLDAASAGRYVAPFSVASRGMMLANSALCDLFRPILFDAENSGDPARARATFDHWLLCSVALSAVGLAVVFLGGSLIARLLLAPVYRPGAVLIMVWVSLGYAVSGLTQIVENRLLSLGHSGRLLLPMILGALANVGFSIWLIHWNGIVGAAQATCASFVFQNLATVGFLIHALRDRRADDSRETHIEPA